MIIVRSEYNRLTEEMRYIMQRSRLSEIGSSRRSCPVQYRALSQCVSLGLIENDKFHFGNKDLTARIKSRYWTRLKSQVINRK